MESLLNTCFASFQRLSTASVMGSTTSSSSSQNKSIKPQKTMDQIGKPPISRQWSNFLRFLSSLYSQVCGFLVLVVWLATLAKIKRMMMKLVENDVFDLKEFMV